MLWALPVLLAGQAAADGFRTQALAPGELRALGQDGQAPLTIDLRDPGEYRAGHIPGAIGIPEPELVARLGELDPARPVVLYCLAGKRTKAAETTLLDAGFGQVRHLAGGLGGWIDAGLPVAKGAQPGQSGVPPDPRSQPTQRSDP
jgi:rhodanese-related sulfurtransferase